MNSTRNRNKAKVMFKCIGVCSRCGKCRNAALMSRANDRKAKNLIFPEDFNPDTGGEGYGVAFDIGTTTVVGMLWNLETGRQLGALAEANPQNEYGMDVISRITYCIDNPDGLKTLHERIAGCLNRIISELCARYGIGAGDIRRLAVCGNTTMSHLLLGKSPKSLAFAPFSPAYEGAVRVSAGDLGIKAADDAEAFIFPNIAGHVGGDITSGILASRLPDKRELTLFIDIGTNGEIALTDGKKCLVCSTAAGPAFEGASILFGMRAAEGAIEKVIMEDGDVFIRTIGDCAPQGICGTGIIDAVAQMLKEGLINRNGRMAGPDDAGKLGLSLKYRERLVTEGKERRFIIAEGKNGENIVITQKDIREIQLAKGAISTGVQLMLAEIGKTTVDIAEAIVAGAFGSHIDRESAVRIGILPDVPLEKIRLIGNAAGAGVSMAMMSAYEMRRAEEIPSGIIHVKLAEKEEFNDVYMAAIKL